MELKKIRIGVLTDSLDKEAVLFQQIAAIGYEAKKPKFWSQNAIKEFVETEMLDMVICFTGPRSIPSTDWLLAFVKEKRPIVKRIKLVNYAARKWGLRRFMSAAKKDADAVILNNASHIELNNAINRLYRSFNLNHQVERVA